MRIRVCYLLFCGVLLLLLVRMGPGAPLSAAGPAAADEGAAAFSKVRFIPPGGTEAGPYRADAGWGGGCLLLPYYSDAGSESAAGSKTASEKLRASGMVCFYRTGGAVAWDGGAISSVTLSTNHSSFEAIGPVDRLAAPAFLMRGEHDLYTAAVSYAMEEEGIDLTTVKTTASYWYVFFARPEDETGVVIGLDADRFSREETLRFAQSVQYEGDLLPSCG